MMKVFKVYVKPIVQYGVLVYGCTNLTLLNKLDKGIKRILRIITFKRKPDSVVRTRELNQIPLATELHVYELFKLFIKLIRGQSSVNILENCFSDYELAKLRTGRNKSISIIKHDYSKNCIITRVRKLANIFARSHENFIENVESMNKVSEINSFAHNVLENFIIGNNDLIKAIFK